jgi:putative transposase
LTHTQRWHAHDHHTGTGHLYQGRFKSFPIAEDDHFLTVCRYVERNALRAKLVERAEDWRWGSLWCRQQSDPELRRILSPCPVAMPRGWVEFVNQPQTDAELTQIRTSLQRGRPYGGDAWAAKTAKKLGLESTFRPRGRPPTQAADEGE